MATPIYITPSTTFVKIDEFQLQTQSPFTTVVLSTVAYQGQTVTILDRSGLAQAARPIVLSTSLGVSFSDLTFSTLIDQPKGFLTVQSDGSVWSRLNTFPFWNQPISSGVSFLHVSTLYTSINSTSVESANYMNVENLVITGRFPPTNTAAVVRDLTILNHSELLSSVVAWTPVYFSSFLSTFSSFTIVSSLSVTGPINVQSTLRTLSSMNISTSAFATSLSTAFINILRNITASTIEVQQSTTGPSVNLGGSITFQQNLSLFSSLNTGGAITTNTLSVGSTLSTVGTLAVGNSLFISTSVSTGTLYQKGPLRITGSASVYGTVQASSMSAYSLVAKNGLFLDNSLEISSASIQNLRTLGTLSSGGQTVALSYFSTLQALDIQFMTASSTRTTVQGAFSTVGSLLVSSQLIELSSMYLQGYLSTASTVTVGKNALFQGPVQITGSIVFTSSLTFLSSLNVLNTLSINTASKNVSTSIVGNLFAYSTVTVTGLAILSSISLNNRAIVNEIVIMSSFITSGYLSTPQVNYSSQQVYTSSLGIGYPSTSYTFQAYNALSSQILNVSSLASTSKVISYGYVQTSSGMAIAMNSLGQGLDVGGLAKINGSINAFQTISSQGLYASTIYGTLYGNALGLSNFPVQDMVSTSRIYVSTTIASNVSTGFFMASTGVVYAPLSIASTLNLQRSPFIANNNGSIQGTTTNRIQAYPRQFLQLNNAVFVSSGLVGINTSTPKYILHVEKTLGVGGIAGAAFTYRNVNYNTLTMSTMTNLGPVSYVNSGILTTSNLVVDSSPGANGYVVRTYKRFSGPTGFNPNPIIRDSSGNLYTTNGTQNTIYKISPSGVTTVLAGGNVTGGFVDGTGAAAQFWFPINITIDSNGNLYVVDLNNHSIRKVTQSGVVTTLAGNGSSGFADGTGAAAQFYQPEGIAIDSNGNLYVADANNNRIRKITPSGVVTTLAGNATGAFADGTGALASFNFPMSITLASNGNLYVADYGNNCIRIVTLAGLVTTVRDQGGSIINVRTLTGTVGPSCVAVDTYGNIYVTTNNSIIYRITTNGVLSVFAGSSVGYVDGLITTALFKLFVSPGGLYIDTNNNNLIYVSDTNNGAIRTIASYYVTVSTINRIQTTQSTLNVNNFMYIGPSSVGIGVGISSPKYTLDTYSLLTTSSLTAYTSEVNASIQVNPTEKSIWVATGPTNYTTTSNMRYSLDDGNTWLSGDDLQNWNITRGSAYNGSYWVSPGNPIMTSPDGVTWTPIDNQGGSDLGSFLTGGGKVAWNGSYWVATGPSSNKAGTLLKSQDGINWTPSLSGGFTTGSVYQGSDILWTGSQWIATGLALTATPISSIQWSQDGLNWSSITSGGFLTGGNGLSFGPKIPYTKGFEQYQGNSLLFAVGNDSSISSIQYTYDGGYNWSTITSGGFSIKGNGIDTDGRYLIAAGRDGTPTNNIQVGSIQTNPLTISFQSYTTFTGTSIPDFTDRGNCVKWNGSEWLLGGNNGLRKLIPTSNSYFSSFTIGGTYIKRNIIAIERAATSFPLYTLDGGSTWTYGSPLYAGFSNSLIETNGAGKWVMVGRSAPASWYSTDGINWSQITNIPLVYPSQQAQDLRFLNNKWFIAANDSTNNYSTFMTSVDGINWSNNPITVSGIGASNVATILYGNGLYVAAAGQYSRPYYSYDLTTWTVGSGNFLAGGLYGSVGAYGNGVFLMAGFSKYSSSNVSPGESPAEDPTHPVVRSTDGITWTYINATAFGFGTRQWINITSITHSPTLNRFILGGFGTGIFYSSDGSTWTLCSGVPSGSGGSGLNYLGSAWTGDQFIISPYTASYTNYPFYFSSDGITFVQGPFFSQSFYNNYGVRGYITTDTNDQTEYTSFAYSSNVVPSLTTSSFSILANSDLNTIDSQLPQNSMAIQSNTIVLNDIFTVTDKVVNIGYHPLNQTIANQSSLYIFHNLEITGSLSTGSASISSLYLGIQSV